MQLEGIKGRSLLAITSSLIIAGLSAGPSFGDEPKGLGRLFRLGGNSSSSSSANQVPPSTPMTRPVQEAYVSPALSTPPSSQPGTSSGPRLTPKSRVSKPVTEADPLVTRVSLGRSDNGSQFGMFLQVFADGTVIDGEGVHHVSAEVLKPVFDAVSNGDLGRFKGFCGGPAGDFIESVQVVAYERSLGRLRANAFSYSGNTQGCDHAVHHLQKTLDELQTKLGGSSSAPSMMAPTVNQGSSNGSGLLASPPIPLSSTP